MPIISLNGHDAIRIRKTNEYANWGNRNEENRVEPITNPAFAVPFRLKKGERVFTIGSCFARNVETKLQQRGFRIPIRDLFKKKTFLNLSPEIVNNFGTPSIYNEFAWAFREESFEEEANFVELGPDKYVDLQMVNSVRPSPLDLVRERRHGLFKATRMLAKCRVMIMTLGLVELWWDNLSQTYLNTSPLPMLIKRDPKRFELHVLDFDECSDYLRRALDIAFKYGRKDLSVILTVSPVPMMTTHRNSDVITANSYSKSMLRTVAEHLVAADERITYFPSYETVSMSNRQFSWSDDFVHVREDMIAMNVDRMVNAFTGGRQQKAALLPDFDHAAAESAESLLLAENARLARIEGDTDFFDAQPESALESPAYVLEYAKYLYENQRYDPILELSGESIELGTMQSKSLLALGRLEEAKARIRPICLSAEKGVQHWRTYIEVALALQSKPALLKAEAEWIERQPRAKLLCQSYVGQALGKLGAHEEVVERLRNVVADPDRSDSMVIAYAKSLISLKRLDEAADILDGVTGNTDWQTTQIRQLKQRISKLSAQL